MRFLREIEGFQFGSHMHPLFFFLTFQVEEYLKLDVIALREIYRRYSCEMYECFHLDVTKRISPSQFALHAWQSTCVQIDQIFLPHAGFEEDVCREAYRGGRVMCQRRAFESQDWKVLENEMAACHYDKIDDYLVIPDVNSLYPTVCFQEKYAYGKWRFLQPNADDYNFHTLVVDADLSPAGAAAERIERSCYCVDLTCPRDLLTAFLMDRNDDGGMNHTLEDKNEYWVWGCELAEAVRLGYCVTKIHSIMEFEHLGDLFKPYIHKCWEGRKANPGSDNVKNYMYKLAMNALTGKFGQRSELTNSAIFATDYKQTPQTEHLFKEVHYLAIIIFDLFLH